MAPTSTLEPAQDTERTTKLAPRWSVILHNDPITTMDFVTDLLRTLFHKSQADAVRLMYEVHNSGSAVVEITSLERAELYCEQIASLARPRGFPLVATLEPAE
jgi:ATP-dependent Clp protease adaptor protein ClpS